MLVEINNNHSQPQIKINLTWIIYYLTVLFSLVLLNGCNNSGITSTSVNSSNISKVTASNTVESTYPVIYNNVVYILDNNVNAIYMYQANESKFQVLSPSIESVATGDDPAGITIDPSKHFVYVPNFGSNSIYCYTINQDTGILSFTESISIDSPTAVVVDHAINYAYATSSSSNKINLFRIKPQTGVLQYITSYDSLDTPCTLSIDSHGEYLYVGHFIPGGEGKNNVERFKIESGLLDSKSVTSITAGSYNTVLVNSQNNSNLYAGSFYAQDSSDASNNITSFAIDGNGNLVTLNTIGKNSDITEMLLVNDEFLYVSDSYNNKIDMYKVESQSGELKYFPNESDSSIMTSGSVSDMALAQKSDKQMIFAVSNDPTQTFTRYTIDSTGRIRSEGPVPIPNMQDGNHSAYAIAVANLIPDELKVINKMSFDLSGEIIVQAPSDVDANSLKPELYLIESGGSAPAGMVGGAPWILIPEIIEIVAIVATGGSVSVTLKTHAEDFKDGDQFIFKISAKDKNGDPIPPVDGKKLRLIVVNRIIPAKNTDVNLDLKQIDFKLVTMSLNPADALFLPRFDPFTARCDTVTVTQQPEDKSQPASVVPCADVVISGKNGDVLSYQVPKDFKFSPKNVVLVSFSGSGGPVYIEDYSSALGKYDEMPMKYEGSFTTTDKVPELVIPDPKTNASVHTDLIVRFPRGLQSGQETNYANNFKVISQKEGAIHGRFKLVGDYLQFMPDEQLLAEDRFEVTLENFRDKLGSTYETTAIEMETGEEDSMIIYEATNNDAGFLGNFGVRGNFVRNVDYICNHDPNRPVVPYIDLIEFNAMITNRNDRYYAYQTEAGVIVYNSRDWVLRPGTEYYNKNSVLLGATPETLIGTTTANSIFDELDIPVRTEPSQLTGSWTNMMPNWVTPSAPEVTCNNFGSAMRNIVTIAAIGNPLSLISENLVSGRTSPCTMPQSLLCVQRGGCAKSKLTSKHYCDMFN